MNEQRQEHTVEVADLLGLFARSLRRLWWLCLMLIVLCAAAFGGYARLSYRPQYTASMTFLVNVGGAGAVRQRRQHGDGGADGKDVSLHSHKRPARQRRAHGHRASGSARDFRIVGGGHEPMHPERDRQRCTAVLRRAAVGHRALPGRGGAGRRADGTGHDGSNRACRPSRRIRFRGVNRSYVARSLVRC